MKFGRFLLDHPVVSTVPLILAGLGWCSISGDEGVVAEPLASPDGGEVWAVGRVDSLWLAVGPGGTYTSLDEAATWSRVGPAPLARVSARPDPLSIHVLGRTLFFNVDGAVYRTTDAGRRWETSVEGESQVFQFAGHLYALTAGLLLRSTDEGRTWSDTVRALPGPSPMTFGTAAEVVTGSQTAYLSDGWTALRSSDGGRNWQPAPGIVTPQPAAALRGPPAGPGVKADYAILRDTLYALVSTGIIKRSADYGDTWSELPGRITRPRAGASKLFAGGAGLWVSGDGATCRVRTGDGGCDVLPGLPTLNGIAATSILVAATAEGPWRSADQGTRWTPAHKGIPAQVNGVAAAGRTYFAIANRQIFRSADSAMAWTPSREFTSPPHTMWTDGSRVFAFTADSLVSCDTRLGCGTRPVRLPAGSGDTVEVLRGTAHQLNGIIRVGGRLRPSQRGAVLRSENQGQTWRVEAFTPDPLIQRVWVADSMVYALTDAGIALAGRGLGAEMRTVAPFRAAQQTVTAVAGGRALLAAQEGTLLAFDPADRTLRQLTSGPVLGRIDALWTSVRQPEVVVAATERGHAWSEDGGKSFRPGRIRDEGAPPVHITTLVEASDTTLLAGAANGIYRLRYSITPPTAVGRLVGSPLGKVLLTALLATIGFPVLLWDRRRRGKVESSYGIRGIIVRMVPSAVRVRTFFAFYDDFLTTELRGKEAPSFFALPARAPDRSLVPITSDSSLVDALAESSDSRAPVLLTAEGGAGKSTVLYRIMRLYLQGDLPARWAPFRPVLVRAGDYHESLQEAVATVLRDRYGIDVNKESVLPLLASEPLLILFDGASEIEADDREATYDALVKAAASHDFTVCRVVIATRPMQSTSTDCPSFDLLPLTLQRIEGEVLAQYGLDDHEKDHVLRQLKRLGSDGVTPLLLYMAVEAARGGQDSSSEAGLYQSYFRKLLRIEKESADVQWLGWSHVLSTLAGESVIARGQRGVGFLHEQGINSLKVVIPNLKSDYGIKRVSEPEQALNKLAAARILTRNKRRWRFTHDRFEEYFAAAYFVRTIEDEGKWPAVEKWTTSNERIAEFADVLRFAIELGTPEDIRRCAPQNLPHPWREALGLTPGVR